MDFPYEVPFVSYIIYELELKCWYLQKLTGTYELTELQTKPTQKIATNYV